MNEPSSNESSRNESPAVPTAPISAGASDASPSPPSPAVSPAPWAHLRRYTAARIALGRSGGSLPTQESLAFSLDHALARDAVHTPFDPEALAAELRALPGVPEICVLTSAASDRATYLRRPDLGRRLSAESAKQLVLRSARSPTLSSQSNRSAGARLSESSSAPPLPPPSASDVETPPSSLAIIVSDGLSALAAQRQAPALLRELLPRLRAANFAIAPLCVVHHARVGIIDEIGSALRADFALILLGERPGLGTPDSLSAYFTRAPAPGRTDADRNCISNIRPVGLPPADAAIKLTAWLTDARTLHRSGVALKEPAAASGPSSVAKQISESKSR
jgi:ethanolamine ammonia-lyase small subunit